MLKEFLPTCIECGQPLFDKRQAEYRGVFIDLDAMTYSVDDAAPKHICPRLALGLLVLIQAHGRVVPWSEFEDRIWPGAMELTFDLCQSMGVLVYQLRKLGIPIVNVFGIGYRLGRKVG